MKPSFSFVAGDCIRTRSLPFVIGVLADLGSARSDLPAYGKRRFVQIDSGVFDRVLEAFTVEIEKSIKSFDEVICNPEDGNREVVHRKDAKTRVKLSFRQLADFQPENMAYQIVYCRALLRERESLANLFAILPPALEETLGVNFQGDWFRTGPQDSPSEQPNSDGLTPAPTVSGPNLFAETVAAVQRLVAASKEEAVLIGEWLGVLRNLYVEGCIDLDKGVSRGIAERIATIDAIVGDAVTQVYEDPRVHELEATWRSVRELLRATADLPEVVVKIMHVSRAELDFDFSRGDFQSTRTYRRIVDAEVGCFGGEPFNMLIAGFDFTREAHDLHLLERLTEIGAAGNTVVLAAASPRMFGCESFDQLASAPDLARFCASSLFAKWNGLRSVDESRYLGLVVPRVVLRKHAPRDAAVPRTFRLPKERLIYGSAAYPIAARFARRFSSDVWYAPEVPARELALETQLPGAAAVEMRAAGFVPASMLLDEIFSARSTVQDPEEEIVRVPGCRLLDVLAVSRFAHPIGSMIRENAERFGTAQEWRTFLEGWLTTYAQRDGGSGCPCPWQSAEVDVQPSRTPPSGSVDVTVVFEPQGSAERIPVRVSGFSLRLLATEAYEASSQDPEFLRPVGVPQYAKWV